MAKATPKNIKTNENLNRRYKFRVNAATRLNMPLIPQKMMQIIMIFQGGYKIILHLFDDNESYIIFLLC